MDLQSVCRDVMDDVDGSLGCVLTDLETGLPLAAEYRAGTVMNANTITLVSYVGIDLFRGKLVRNFERSLSRNREGSGGFVREVQMTTSNTYQFMSSVPGWEQVVFILVTNKNVSLGMGLLAVHDAVRRFREIPRRAFAPAVNPTFRPREEASEPSTPTLTQPLEQRRTEPQRDSTFDAPEQARRLPARGHSTHPSSASLPARGSLKHRSHRIPEANRSQNDARLRSTRVPPPRKPCLRKLLPRTFRRRNPPLPQPSQRHLLSPRRPKWLRSQRRSRIQNKNGITGVLSWAVPNQRRAPRALPRLGRARGCSSSDPVMKKTRTEGDVHDTVAREPIAKDRARRLITFDHSSAKRTSRGNQVQ